MRDTETWLSGRKHLAANEAGAKAPRGFKSHRLRQNSTAGAAPAVSFLRAAQKLHHPRGIARAAILLEREEKDERREANKQVDEILNRRPCAEEEIHDIPVAAHPVPECDETPVETADDHEEVLNIVQ